MEKAHADPPGSQIRILTASWRDFRGLYELEKACFPEDAWPIWDVLGVLTFPDIVRLKAEQKDRLIGFIAGDQRPSQGVAWIATFGVLPGYRRQGIGSRLLAACEKRLQVGVVRLNVRVSNQSARELYRQRGYRLIGRWPEYYQGKEDALVLEKTLRQETAGR